MIYPLGNGILTPLIKQLTEAALAAELDSYLAQDISANRKNGTTSKTVKVASDNFELATPRDRNGSFEPQLVKKYQTSLSDEIEHKIILLLILSDSWPPSGAVHRVYIHQSCYASGFDCNRLSTLNTAPGFTSGLIGIQVV